MDTIICTVPLCALQQQPTFQSLSSYPGPHQLSHLQKGYFISSVLGTRYKTHKVLLEMPQLNRSAKSSRLRSAIGPNTKLRYGLSRILITAVRLVLLVLINGWKTRKFKLGHDSKQESCGRQRSPAVYYLPRLQNIESHNVVSAESKTDHRLHLQRWKREREKRGGCSDSHYIRCYYGENRNKICLEGFQPVPFVCLVKVAWIKGEN